MPKIKDSPGKAARLKVATVKLPGSARKARAAARELQNRATALDAASEAIKQSLRDSEENFHTFFETLDDMVFVGNQDGQILFSNRGATRKLGYAPEELRTMLLIELHPAELRQKAEEIVGAMLRKERETCPLPLETKSGGRLLVETRVWPGKWDGQDCLFGLCKDITGEQEAQQRFELLFRNSPAIMALSTLPERRFVDVNTEFLSALGYSKAEVIGKTALEIGIFPDAEAMGRTSATLESDGRLHSMELQVRRADGTLLEGLFSAEVVVMKGQRHLLSVWIDVTALNRATRLLQESEGRFRRMADSAPVLLWESGTDGLCHYFNKPWLDFTGRTLEQELGNGWAEGVHPDDLETCLHTYRLALQAQQEFKMEYRLRRADGEYRWLQDHGVPRSAPDGSFFGFIGSCLDITEIKQADEEGRQLAERLAMATQAGGVGIWDWDVANDALVWDDNMYRQYGITRDQFTGAYEAWTAGLHPDDRERGDAEIQMALRGEKDFNTEFRVLWPDGNIHHIRAMALVQRDAGGTPLHMIGTNWDVTDEKRAEAVVLQNLARAEELTRLKSRFVSMASHELRTPLANIMLACEILKNFGGAMPPERSQSVLSGLMTGVSSMVCTLDDLLLAGKIEEGKLPFTPVRFALLDFLKRCCQEVQPALQSPTRIDIAFRDAGLRVMADERLLHHILKNLLENALKYSPDDTRVELGVEAGPGSLTLTVLDRGIGVPEADRTFLFDVFSRASNVGDKPGSGLGLFVAQKCAHAHGGRMRYSPQPAGSVFSVTVPLVASADFHQSI
jgi:PAS domain S-box-containing protein